MLDQIERRYNPENDMPRNAPPVTWAEYDLYLAIQDLIKRVEALENENVRLKQAAKGESIE